MTVRSPMPEPEWSRALMWSDHDARAARRDRWKLLWVCLSLILTGYGFTMTAYVCSQLLLGQYSDPPPLAAAPPPPAPAGFQHWPYPVTWSFGP